MHPNCWKLHYSKWPHRSQECSKATNCMVLSVAPCQESIPLKRIGQHSPFYCLGFKELCPSSHYYCSFCWGHCCEAFRRCKRNQKIILGHWYIISSPCSCQLVCSKRFQRSVLQTLVVHDVQDWEFEPHFLNGAATRIGDAASFTIPVPRLT